MSARRKALKRLVDVTGIEPVTPACKAGALPAELHAHAVQPIHPQ